MIFFLNYLVLAWTEPPENPPSGNVPAPLNVGVDGQSKAGGLILNTGNATTGLVVTYGNVGIGTTTPAFKLDVNGMVSVNNNRITKVATPVDAKDAVNKEYVDAAGGGSTYTVCYVLYSKNQNLSCDTGYTQVAKWNKATACWDVSSLYGSTGTAATYLGLAGSLVAIQFTWSDGSAGRCQPDLLIPTCTGSYTSWNVPFIIINGVIYKGLEPIGGSLPVCNFPTFTLGFCCK